MERLLGIMETNGSFVTNIIKNNAFSSGFGVSLNYTFRSTEKDLLNHIQILLKDKTIDSKIKNNTLLIVGLGNLQKFVKIIDKCGNFISFKRQLELLIFKDILNMYSQKLHLTEDGVEKIRSRKNDLTR